MQTNQTYDLLTQVQRIASGDESAFASLFYQFGPRLHSYLTGITKSETAEEELVQNTFIRLAASFPVDRNSKSFRLDLPGGQQ
ncbi:RNA polymerase sigma factor [Pseudobacter ginsenosidimutans]|uniref:Sigma-70-like protein n=1 Tax=Pseudobacter ginsenosidimutans TaxID=661488 RepID=A0A4Q7MLY1_9BACT|nr:hypothetical protein [Pseudobacter ginsenosidimutans]QEC40379.1 hypothetical protein FSB84_01220 [Pseudobacter ginsenosidimutans]RZS69017.1 hypothetical protein EV199_4841 [Pseudobacter ginsenosidimutans]